jgi:hypothetical protein
LLSTQEEQEKGKEQEDIIRKRVELTNRHDLGALDAFIDSYYSPDVTLYDPALPRPVKGRENLKRYWELVFKAFPDVHDEVLSLVSSQNNKTAAIEVVENGTFTGTLQAPGWPAIPQPVKRSSFKAQQSSLSIAKVS